MEYNIYLNNGEGIFDSKRGFDDVADAIEWGFNRNGSYTMQIDADERDCAVILGVTDDEITYCDAMPGFYADDIKSVEEAAIFVRESIGAAPEHKDTWADLDEMTIEEVIKYLEITRKDGTIHYRFYPEMEEYARDYTKRNKAAILRYLDERDSANK